ncbi:MAG: PD-(D/E)XK nuclease family transposase [Methylococcales bacterium]|nr:PD-(D/E)XK nuclease family transposase [Methylococcales bacterium]
MDDIIAYPPTMYCTTGLLQMIDVAPLRYGVIFKKVFSKPAIFTAFVKDILGLEIEIEKVETEKSFSPVIGHVDSRFDLYAEDKKNHLIIDIQHRRYQDHYDRFLHYHCVALLDQITSASNYKPKMNVYTIVVLTSGDKHKTDILINDFKPRKLDHSTVSETEHKIVYLCPKYVNDKTPEPYQEWLRLINDSLDEHIEETDYQNDTIQKIFPLIEKNTISPQDAARMIDEYSDEQYLSDECHKAMREGVQQEKIENAKAMITEGLDLSLISKITGISEQELQSL